MNADRDEKKLKSKH